MNVKPFLIAAAAALTLVQAGCQTAQIESAPVTEGDDKAAKHPYLVEEADLLVLNKIDLLSYVRFDVEAFRDDVRRLNPTVPILEISATTGQGLDAWLAWLVSAGADAPPFVRNESRGGSGS